MRRCGVSITMETEPGLSWKAALSVLSDSNGSTLARVTLSQYCIQGLWYTAIVQRDNMDGSFMVAWLEAALSHPKCPGSKVFAKLQLPTFGIHEEDAALATARRAQ